MTNVSLTQHKPHSEGI